MISTIYETTLKTADLHQWLNKKKAEKIGFVFKIGKFRTEKMPDGFKIKKAKVGRGLVLPPRIAANMIAPGKLEIAIRPHFAGVTVFPAVWILVTCVLILNTKRSLASISELFPAILFFTFIIGLVGHISVTWPVFDARKWIERELDLQRQTP